MAAMSQSFYHDLFHIPYPNSTSQTQAQSYKPPHRKIHPNTHTDTHRYPEHLTRTPLHTPNPSS